ncbi:MAG: glycosyltransferase family 39 protein [Bacteroidales bacterium]|jgi:4-amino-4-deoxy-L-arabinose transferase-like glycosyltransferase|nr:glycosyltransferase family 39 protein [Bacteroidales bacterium]
MSAKKFLEEYWKYLLLFFLISIPVFQHLGTLPIRIWDESRLAINAYEMYHNGNWLVPTYEGSPDLWNTKPPLMIWLQVFFMKLMGISELSVRMPSALAALFTCVCLLLFSVRYLKNFWFGFICNLVLITSAGFVDIHSSRTGDYDALLTLFLTLSALLFFLFIETSKNKYLYLFFLFLLLGFLTKSATALMILPAFFIYTLLRRKMLEILKNKHFYVGLSVTLFLAVGYYFLREIYNPGYMDAVAINEFGGRFFDTIESHKHGFWFYYNNLISTRLPYWMIFIPCGIAVGIFSKDERIKNVTLFSFIAAITFFIVISSAQTKLFWYDVPLFPFLAILIAVFLHFIFSFLKDNKRIFHYLKCNIISGVFIFLIFLTPYRQTIDRTHKFKEYPYDVEFYKTSHYLREIVRGKRDMDDFIVLYTDHPAHILFYVDVLQDKGKNISLRNKKEVKIGEIVLASQDEVKQSIELEHDYNVVDEYDNVKIYKIIGKK